MTKELPWLSPNNGAMHALVCVVRERHRERRESRILLTALVEPKHPKRSGKPSISCVSPTKPSRLKHTWARSFLSSGETDGPSQHANSSPISPSLLGRGDGVGELKCSVCLPTTSGIRSDRVRPAMAHLTNRSHSAHAYSPCELSSK